MTAPRPRVLLSIGDPNGIGPELAVKTVAALQDDAASSCPVLVGDRFVVESYARQCGFQIRETVGSAEPVPGVVDLLPVDALPRHAFRPGTVDGEAGRATVAYLATAVKALGRGHVRAIVACPHSETAVNAAGIAFSGYPGLLAKLAGVDPAKVFLLLVGGGLRIVHATLHERLADALARLTPDVVHAAGLAVVDTLRSWGVHSPRVGVFGVNPHAGEGGLFGADDDRITAPAVERLRRAGADAHGPLGADVLLQQEGFDAFVAMFHDQGHIPVKLLAGRQAVAVSIGAGLVFCTVGHGSAFDIAGQGVADPEAVLRAVRLVGQAPPSRSRPDPAEVAG